MLWAGGQAWVGAPTPTCAGQTGCTAAGASIRAHALPPGALLPSCRRAAVPGAPRARPAGPQLRAAEGGGWAPGPVCGRGTPRAAAAAAQGLQLALAAPLSPRPAPRRWASCGWRWALAGAARRSWPKRRWPASGRRTAWWVLAPGWGRARGFAPHGEVGSWHVRCTAASVVSVGGSTPSAAAAALQTALLISPCAPACLASRWRGWRL